MATFAAAYGVPRDPSRLILIAALCLAAIAGCPQPESTIVGQWREVGDNSITDFRADGTFSSGPINGRYRQLGGDEVSMNFDEFPEVTMIMHCWVSSKRMRLTFRRIEGHSILPDELKAPSEFERVR